MPRTPPRTTDRWGRAVPNGTDATFVGTFPLHAWAPAPLSGVACVYWLLDAGGAVLYVGSTAHLRARLRRHASDGKTFTRWRAVTFDSRRAAYDAERAHIAGLRPPYNRVGVPT